MVEYNVENMVKLATYMVENMNSESLEELAYTYIIDGYDIDEDSFQEDWSNCFEKHPDLRLFRHEGGYET